MDLTRHIRDVPDFPKPGIVFKDITPLLLDPQALQSAIDQMAAPLKDRGVTAIVGIESRGFLFAPGIALQLGCKLVPARKPGKLPWKLRSVTYDLEYGSDTVEMHEDALSSDDTVVVIDDVLATGGTARAVCDLVEGFGARVLETGFVIDLSFLGGSARLGHPSRALLTY